MGKRIRVQRRGRGSSTFKGSTHKRVAPSRYTPLSKTEGDEPKRAVVEELLHEPGRGSPLIKARADRGVFHLVAPEGVSVGQELQFGENASIATGKLWFLRHLCLQSRIVPRRRR